MVSVPMSFVKVGKNEFQVIYDELITRKYWDGPIGLFIAPGKNLLKCILRDAAAVVSNLKYRLVSCERNGKCQLRHAFCMEYGVFQKIQ